MGVKISNLPAIVSPAASDVFPVVQSGVTYKETITQLATFIFTNPLITEIVDSFGNIVVQFAGNAAGVNYLILSNNVTGQAPYIAAAGSDTNVPLAFVTQGDSGLLIQTKAVSSPGMVFRTGTNAQHQTNFLFVDTATTVNVTFPDQSGTVYLASKANGTEGANAVTASGTTGVITTSALTTGAGASYAITWTNTFITTSSTIILSLMGGTNTKDTLQIKATAGAGTSTLTITNNNAAALDGTVIIGYVVIP